MTDPTIDRSVSPEGEQWSDGRSVDEREAVSVGDQVVFEKRVTNEEVETFAKISGDTNRLHLDDSFAEETRFDQAIAHGVLMNGLTSAALARLPGVVVLLRTETDYLKPATPGVVYEASVTVTEELGEHRYAVDTKVTDDGGEAVVEGEAVVLLDPVPTDGS